MLCMYVKTSAVQCVRGHVYMYMYFFSVVFNNNVKPSSALRNFVGGVEELFCVLVI